MAEMHMKKAVVCLLAGAVTGAAIALLYAPQTGVRTKKDIRRFARKTVGRLDDLQTNIRDQVTDWVDDMTEVVKEGVDRGARFSAGGYEQMLQRFDNTRKCFEDGRSRLEKLITTT